MFYYEKCVFMASGRLPFSLFIHCPTSQSKRMLLFSLVIINKTLNVCSKQAGREWGRWEGWYGREERISIVRLMLCYKKCGRPNQYCTNFIKLFMKVNCCFLVSLANYKNLQRLLFSLFNNFYKINVNVCF